MAMETALLGFALPTVIKKLKEILVKKGFRVQTMGENSRVILAYQEGTWYRSPRQVVVHLSEMAPTTTRIDLTAIIENERKDPKAEEVIEEKLVSAIYANFKSTQEYQYGI